jgi:tetratricopeptide (TPR) repeat protein
MIRPQLGVARTEISLRAHSRALLFLLALGCASLLVAAETSLVGITFSFETPTVGRWLLALDADDPRLQNRLGQAYRDIDPAESLRHLRRATQLSPHSRLYWSDLESACESMADTECIDQAGERLLKLCPMAPSYHWLAAQSSLRTNQLDRALAEFRRLLELDPTYAAATWSSLQPVEKPDPIFQKVLADSADVQLKVGYVNFLSDQGDNDTAYRIWKLTVANPRPFPFTSASPYLERLIALGRIEEAVNVWQDLKRLGIVKRYEANEVATRPETKALLNEKDNLIFNGDFEQSPMNAGFDWRASPQTFLAVDFSAPGAYHGAHCLRVDFTVSRNDEYEPAYQIVPVLPHHAYTLQAYIRSEDITSDTGPCLRVSDTQQPSFPDAISDTTVGTTPWHPLRLSFSTGPQTRAVRLSFWRPRSRVFPTEISGTCWLDAVSLECLGPEQSEAKIVKGKG